MPRLGEARRPGTHDADQGSMTDGLPPSARRGQPKIRVWANPERMDFFVHASVRPEPFGGAIVEAMTVGVPVIASVDGGDQDIATHATTAPRPTPSHAAERQRLGPGRMVSPGGHRSEHDGGVRACVSAVESAASMITSVRASTASARRTHSVSATTSA